MITNKYRLVTLAKAERDIDRTVAWLAERSPQGAQSWLVAFEKVCSRGLREPDSFGIAPEDELFSRTIRQCFFRTPHGQTYRILYLVVDNEVRLLRVRGPCQDLLTSEELM